MDMFEGMYPVYFHPENGKFTSGPHNSTYVTTLDLVSYGGLGDSFYEYLLKQYILSGMKDDWVHYTELANHACR